MQLQNCQAVGVRGQKHFEGTNNNKEINAAWRAMAFSISLAKRAVTQHQS